MKPAFCPYIYSDGVKLFLEFDTFVLDFVFTEAGLHKALKHIPRIDKQPGFVSSKGNLANGRKKPPVRIRIAKKTKSSPAVFKEELPAPEAVDEIVKMLKEGKFK